MNFMLLFVNFLLIWEVNCSFIECARRRKLTGKEIIPY